MPSLSSLILNLSTVIFFVREDLAQRYRADVLGMVWLILQPLVTILLFAIVFSSIMQVRLLHLNPNFGYTVYLIAGILIWNAFAQSVTRLSGWYRDRANLYQKIPLGLYLPPLSVVVGEGILYSVAMVIFVLGLIFIGHGLSLYWLWLPFMLLILGTITFCIGLSLGILEVFIPDIRRAVPIALQLGFWLTPIVYTPDILPDWAQPFLVFNPLAHALGAVQAIVVFNRSPDLGSVFLLIALAFLSLSLPVLLGHRLRKALRDAL